MKRMYFFIILMGFIWSVVYSAPLQDQVTYLPGLRMQPTFKHYSGYLNGTNGIHLHYWFVESQDNPKHNPLVLWLNGGPGCSSLDGLLTEHGPFRVNEGPYLTYNNYSWNKIANVLYLESPACVGYSYSDINNCSADDDTTSMNNYKALLNFFTIFPEYASHDFYITGESYGGYYVPTLAVRVITNPKIKFKGIAVGNGLSSQVLNGNSFAYFMYYHGIISDSFWKDTLEKCCSNQDHYKCDLIKSAESGKSCADNMKKISVVVGEEADINPYNILAKCDRFISNKNPNSLYLGKKSKTVPFIPYWFNLPMVRKVSTIPTNNDVEVVIPCLSSRSSNKYLNLKIVRESLHIPSFLPNWTVCSAKVNLNYKRNYLDMAAQYRLLFTIKDFKILIYNGDIDSMCSYLGDEWFFDDLNIPLIQKRRPWFYHDMETNSQQVAGFVKEFDKFQLATVKGAGHMVPEDKPLQAYAMFQRFLMGRNGKFHL